VDISFKQVEEDTLLEDLDIDSLDVMKLAVVIEKHFNIEITTKELENLQSFGDIISTLEMKIG